MKLICLDKSEIQGNENNTPPPMNQRPLLIEGNSKKSPLERGGHPDSSGWTACLRVASAKQGVCNLPVRRSFSVDGRAISYEC